MAAGEKRKRPECKSTQDAFKVTAGGSAGQRLPPWCFVIYARLMPEQQKKPRFAFRLTSHRVTSSHWIKKQHPGDSRNDAESSICCNSIGAFVRFCTTCLTAALN